MLEDFDDYLNPHQVAWVLNISRTTAYKLMREGKLPAFRIGPKLWRVHKESLVKYLQDVCGIYD